MQTPHHPQNNHYAAVRAVSSNQESIHKNLEAVVYKRLNTEFLRPYAQHSKQAFAEAANWLAEQRKPLILDSFCGIGESSRYLAEQFPDHAVIGIDQSAARLGKHINQFGELPDNVMLLRADCDDIWRMAVDAGWRCEQHFLLYPNPWPKSAHLQRRIHGSPVFKSLLALSKQLELRSNWLIYMEEFQKSLALAEIPSKLEQLKEEEPITAFERKYQANGQTLWQLRAQLPL